MLRDLKYILILLALSFGCVSLASKNKDRCLEHQLKVSNSAIKKKKHIKRTLSVVKTEEIEELQKEPTSDTFTVCVSLEQGDENGFSEPKETCYDLIR